MGIYGAGVAGGTVCYVAVFVVSVWTAVRKRKKLQNKSLDNLILANRGVGLILGIVTLVGKL